MKRIARKTLLTTATLLSFSLTFACGDSKDEVVNPTPTTQANVTVTPESLSPDFQGGTFDISVTANVDWSIRTEESWISVRPAGGVKNETTTVKVTVDPNKGMEERYATLSIISSNTTVKTIQISQSCDLSASASVSSIIMSGEGGQREFTVTANGNWILTADASWVTLTPDHGSKGETSVTIAASKNDGNDTREGVLTLTCGNSVTKISISQLNYNVETPEGYHLVWNDEFDYEGTPMSDWVIENQSQGWVNNELQNYTSRQVDGKYTLEVKDGFLYVNCFKGSDGKVYSGRMNAKPNTGWQYGYVEARINLPSGKGTWPAFWMMPSNVDWNKDPWPYCGEIDIMEEVGVVPNEVSSSIHTGKYNHTIGTQKTHAMTIPGAEGNFHIYAMEWDEEKLITYVDGKVQLKVTKAELGSDHASWPFDRAFYPIVNLAWGGDWGGMNGVNENALPVTMLVDYVRIFQKD